MTTNRWTQTCWLLGLGLFPLGCVGDEFSSCTSGACGSDAEGGEAGADTDGVSSADARNATSSTSAGGAGGSGGSEGASGSGGASGSLASPGSGGSSAGSSGGTTRGEAGSGSFREGGAGVTSTCEDTCTGACCGEVCVDLESDPDHCGACGTPCELDHAQAACVAGSCAVTACQDDHIDCNGEASDGCEEAFWDAPTTPDLRRPMFGAFTGSLHGREVTGSLRPEFAWTEVQPVTCSAVTYQLQVDSDCPSTGFTDCDFPSPELDVTGLLTPDFVPEADLAVEEDLAPVGRRYYWRVRACETSVVCSEWSEVFYVDVGRMREDVTGDGYADVVGVANDPVVAGRLFMIRGGADFGERNTAENLPPTSPPPLNTNAATLSFLGDVNGDGFNDVGAVCGLPDADITELVVLTGGPVVPPASVAPSAERTYHVPGVWAGGDFDRDGYADMVLAKVLPEDAFRQFLKPGEALPNANPEKELSLGPLDDSASELEREVMHAATSGDFNADGYPDLAIDAGSLQTSVSFVFGARTPNLAPQRTIGLFTGKAWHHRAPIMATFDFNGDDIDDLAVLSRSQGQLVIVFGSSDLDTEAVPEIWSVALEIEPKDLAVADLDRTGFGDLVVSGPMMFAGESEPDTTPEWSVSEVATEEPVAIADHNGDGYLDLVLANSWYEGVIVPGQHVELPANGEELDVISLAH